jgi:hypothetical protein
MKTLQDVHALYFVCVVYICNIRQSSSVLPFKTLLESIQMKTFRDVHAMLPFNFLCIAFIWNYICKSLEE